jgi:hypothetical protein
MTLMISMAKMVEKEKLSPKLTPGDGPVQEFPPWSGYTSKSWERQGCIESGH